MLRSLLLAIIVSLVSTSSLASDQRERQGPSNSIHLDPKGERWAQKTLRKLSLEEKVGQLFMVWVRAGFLNVDSPDYLELRDTIRNYHVGGLTMTVPYDAPFLTRSEPYEAATLLNRLQKDSKLPLLVAADFERGITMRLRGGTVFPHAMAFGASGRSDYVEAFGRITAEESRALGVHWNFFPVADVNSNPQNPIINTRSFGEDPQAVGELVAAYIRGSRASGMLTTAKHFPGHGDTATDSHLGVARVGGDRARLESVELVPFRVAIAAGVDAVMVAHVTVPALDPDPGHVATTSSAIVTTLLKGELGFRGIVVSDALEMAGLTSLYPLNTGRAAVDAFKAGTDLLLIPADLGSSYRAMVEAARSGEIPRSALDASVLKLLRAKASLQLQTNRLVKLDELSVRIGRPENQALGQQVADDAVTLVRDNGKVLPLKEAGTIPTRLPYQKQPEVGNRLLVVVFSDDVRTDSGRVLERQIRNRAPEANVIYLDSRLAGALSSEVLAAVEPAEVVVAAVYSVPTAGKVAKIENGRQQNSVALGDASGQLLASLLDRAAGKTVVLAMGNPYLAQDFPAVENYVCTFSNASVSEVSAAKALFGEMEIHGRLPVSIPNIAPRGAGLNRPASAIHGNGGRQDAPPKAAAR